MSLVRTLTIRISGRFYETLRFNAVHEFRAPYARLLKEGAA